MTWSFPPRNIVRVTGADADVQDLVGPNTDPYECVHPDTGGVMQCWRWGPSVEVTTAFPVADCLAAIPDLYDWYTVYILVAFPPVAPGADGECHFFGIYGNCGSIDGESWGRIDGAALVYTGDGHALDTSVSSVGGNAFAIPTYLGAHASNYVLSPAAAYPVPDADGNEAGSVLLTRAQVAALDITFTYGGSWGHWTDLRPYTLHASVLAYNEVTMDAEAPLMCLL